MRKDLFSILLLLLPAGIVLAQNNTRPLASAELIHKGITLHDEGKYKEAANFYKQVTRSDTNYVWALYELGLTYTADSLYPEAMKVYEEALSLTTEREREPDLYSNYASLIDDMGERERAIRIFDSAIAKYPAASGLYLNKGTTLLRMEKYAEAEAVFKKVLLIDPYSYSSHYMLAFAALRQGKVVPAFLGFTAYLMMSPQGRYHKNAIGLLNMIAKNTEDLAEYTGGKSDESNTFKAAEQIVLAKLALDRGYKPIIKLDDPISRQIQVVFEKLEYDDSDNDFWMQYYVPLFSKIFREKKFELFINHIFSGVDIDEIQNYNKKNKKQMEQLIGDLAGYFNEIQASRELMYKKRANPAINYYYQDGKLSGKGQWKNNGEAFIGPWEYYYSAGNIRSKGKFDDKGERDGEWNYFYFPGTLKAKENYKNGKLNGNSIYYYSNGVVSAKEFYKEDLADGVFYGYYFNGQPYTITTYKNGKLNGEKRVFTKEGLLSEIKLYKEDSLDGAYKSFHKNGQVEAVATYVNGKLQGPATYYHSNGKTSIEGSYADNKPAGTWKRYHTNGKLKSVERYVNGELDGDYEEYFDNGTAYTKYPVKKGKASGDVSYYDEDGKLYAIHTFDGGILKKAKYFDKSGKVLSESQMKNRKLDLTGFTPEGIKRSQVVYNEKGELAGPENYYYPSGKLSEANLYKDGVLHGISTSYHRNAKKKSEVNFNEGRKDGYYTSWFQHGQVQQEGWYMDDMAEGYWSYYNEQGAKTTYVHFLNDQQDGVKEEFWANGKKQYESWYNNGVLEKMKQYDTTGKVLKELVFPKASGKVHFVHSNGKTYAECELVNGELEGAYKTYYFDGSLETIQYYKHGLNDSIYKSYAYGGALTTEGQFRMGEKTGTWKYYRQGKLYSTDQWENGEQHGIEMFYHDNGKVDSEREYKNGVRHGITKKYAADGSLMYILRHEADMPVAYSYEDKSGKLLPEIKLAGYTGKVKTFYANGNVSGEFEYVDGKLVNADNLYHPNGKIWLESVEDYSHTNGQYKEFYPSGQLKSVYDYAYDNPHGNFKEYNDKGIVVKEGRQHNGYLHGPIKHYDQQGKLKETYNYHYGQLISVIK